MAKRKKKSLIKSVKDELKSSKKSIKKKSKKASNKSNNSKEKEATKNIKTLQLKTDFDISMDFATKVYQKFNKMIKSIVLFGSSAKKTNVPGSDIDLMIIIDDASIRWDQELIAWYREELEKVIKANPYKEELHINTIKLTTWWDDLLKGDPVVLSILRDGQALIDFGGFFEPLKYLLVSGKIRSTPESIYNLLQRAPQHIARSRAAELNAIEGLYWSMVDSAQAALIALGVSPASPENIAAELRVNFVNSGKLKTKYVVWYRDLLMLHKDILHGKIANLEGSIIDDWQKRSEEFLKVMAMLVDDVISNR